MELSNLKKVVNLIDENKIKILTNWIEEVGFEEFFGEEIKRDEFINEYGVNILNSLIKAIEMNSEIDTSYINKFLEKFNQIDISSLLYMNLKKAIVNFLLENIKNLENIDLKELLSEIDSIFEENIFNSSKENEMDKNLNLLKEYQKAVDESSIVSITDPKGVIKYANDKFCEISKYSKEELIGKPHNIVRHPDMPKEAFANLWETIQNKKVWSGVVKNRKKDGGVYIVNATIVPILDENGEIVEYIGLRQDITELIKTTKLAENYQKAVDVSNIVSITDTKGVIKYVNDKFCEISGYSPNELIGKPHNIVRHPDMPKEAFANLWETITNKKVWNGIVKNRKKDGDFYIVDATIMPILDENNEIIEYIGLRHDLTEFEKQKEREKELIKETIESIKEATKVSIETIIESIPLPSVIIEKDNLILNFNSEFLEIFDMQRDREVISKLKSKNLNLNELLKEEMDFLHSDEMFDWKENLSGNEELDRVIIKTNLEELIFSVKLGEFNLEDKTLYTVCFKNLNGGEDESSF